MANVLVAPSAVIGLMGAQRRQNSLLPFPIQADLLDEMMFQRAPNGYVEGAGGQYFAADRSGQMPMQQQAPATPQRDRVSGWRVLDRVLGGQTISEGLDAERARLQAQAMQPQQMARIQAALGAITDPREQALFLGLGGADWQKNVAQQYAPQVGAPGSVQFIGGRAVAGAPQQYEFGDQRRSFNPVTGQDQLVAERGPTIAEQIARDRLLWDQQYGQSRLGIDQYQAQTGRMNAETGAANAGYTLGEGQARYQNGSLVAENAKPSAANDPAIREQRAQALEGTAGNIGIALGRSRELARNAGTWNQYNPLARQARVDLENNLNTIKANLTFDKLNELKSASPTGSSGLGALSNQEGILLASTVAALSVDMSPQELEQSFKIIDGLVAKMNQSAQALRSAPSGGNTPPLPTGFVLDR